MKENTLWCEQYRPTKIEDLIIPSRIEKIIKGFIKNHDIPSMLFSGSAGCCKTTTAKAICNTLGADYLFINASDETGKADILNQVSPFATGMSYNTECPKIVVLDESDRISGAGLDSLKSYMESYSKNCRFIFTANTPAKIIEPIKSRCLCLDFAPSVKEKAELMAKFLNRCINILKEKNIDYSPVALQHLIINNFPDYRKIINTLQSYSTGYGKIDEGIVTLVDNSIVNSLVPLLKAKNFNGARKWLYESSYTEEDVINALYKGLDSFDKSKIPSIVIVLAEYQYKNAFVANPQLNLMACLTEIMSEC